MPTGVRTSPLPRLNTAPSAARSAVMARVKAGGTTPELRVRQALRAIGEPGYRLHRRDLPGRPDIAFIGRRIAIFVHGCFWHGHPCRRGARVPKTNVDYWMAKIARNRARDAAAVAALAERGWRAIVIWECETKPADLPGLLRERLHAPPSTAYPAPGEKQKHHVHS